MSQMKEMDRKGFLKALGLGMLGVAAAPAIVQAEEIIKPQPKEVSFKILINGKEYPSVVNNTRSTPSGIEYDLKHWQDLGDKLDAELIKLRLNPDQPISYFKQLKEDILYYDKIALDGSYVYQWYSVTNRNVPLALCYYKLGEYNKVDEALTRGLNVEGWSNCSKGNVLIEGAEFYLSLNIPEKAIEYYKLALAYNPKATCKRKLKKLEENA